MKTHVPRIRYLGLGFVSASISATYSTSALFPGEFGFLSNMETAWGIAMLVGALTLFATGVIMRNWPSSRMRQLLTPALVLNVLGMFFSVFSGSIGGAAWLEYVGAALNGAGTAWMCVLWADVLGRIDAEEMEFVVPAASVVTLACTLIVPLLGPLFAAFAVVLLPIASAATLALSYRGLGTSPGGPSVESTGPTLLFGLRLTCLLVALLCVYVAICWIGAASPMPFPVVPSLGGSLFGIALAVCFIAFSVRIDFGSLFRWLGPLIVIGLACCAWGGSAAGTVASTIGEIADTAIQAITYIYFISLARRMDRSPVLGVAFAMAAAQIGAFLGNELGLYTTVLVSAGDASYGSISMALVCVVAFATTIVPRKDLSPFGNLPVQRGVSMRNADGIGGGLDSQGVVSDFDATCERLADRYGLSKRETDVFLLLAAGRSQPYIRERLVLSKSTVSTHVSSIYRKCNVHSKQELLDLLDD